MGAKELAKIFHNVYEKLAPIYGYKTREDTKEFDENTPNGKLMIATCEGVLNMLDAESNRLEKLVAGKLVKGCVVYMKASSGMSGYGNPQCVKSVCEPLSEISLYGHNQNYKTWDVDKIVEYPYVASNLSA